MLWILRIGETPPGQYYWKEIGTTIGPSPDIKEVVRGMVDLRRGNQLPRSDPQQCLEDLIWSVCARLEEAGQTNWCYSTETVPMNINASTGGGGCAGCGAQL